MRKLFIIILAILAITAINAPAVSADSGATIVTPTSWGYIYQLENGDIVEVGDSTTTDFKANVKTIRWNGIAWFSLGWAGGTFTPALDDLTVSFDFDSNIHVSIYPVAPSVRLPEGGIEYDITLDKKPAKPTVTLDVDWDGITWQKILPLNEQYDEAACIEKWGETHTDFVLTPTDITGINIETSEIDTLKHIEEYEVNSYLGTAINAYQDRQSMGIINDPASVFYGEPLIHGNVSRSKLYIHRGQMTDALGDTAWVEDIDLDEQAKTITFTLPAAWLRNAAYPVSQVCGVDPAYSETISSFLSSTLTGDNTWTTVDLSATVGTNSPVIEVICGNQEAGVENDFGVRAVGSSLDRHFNIHEAEGGGETHCRYFVQGDSSGQAQFFHSDISDDDSFYIIGYWENTTFTEHFRYAYKSSGTAGWYDIDTYTNNVLIQESMVHHILLYNVNDNASETLGARTGGSSLDRKLLVHEEEGDGISALDLITKSDANSDIEVYYADNGTSYYYEMGYFGSEMDFVEKWEDVGNFPKDGSWGTVDLTSYLDQDGRVVDTLLVHYDPGNTFTFGVRGGDSSANRYLTEHEAEDNGTSTNENSGFSMSAQTNSSGQIGVYGLSDTADFPFLILTGYFLPASGETPDITNVPTSIAYGTVAASSTFWSNGSEPSWPLTDGDAYCTLTNNSSGSVSVDYKATNFTGGVGWTLTTGSPGENTVRLTVFIEGDGSGDGDALTTSYQTLIASLGASADIDWELKLETGTYTDGIAKSSTLTVYATLL